MKRSVFQKSSVKLPKRGRAPENEEYGRHEKGVVSCPECGNVLFEKRWHPSLLSLEKKAKTRRLTITKEELCPACSMTKQGLYEGELMVERFPARFHEELFNLIFNFGNRATKRDPQDRIIAVSKDGGRFRITTTENQLADRLGKKIKEVFNSVALDIKHSREPYEVDRVRAVYLTA